MSVTLVEITRSEMLESSHTGNIVVASSDGKIIHKLGDPERLTYFHSSAKPIQGIAMLETGIMEKYKLDYKEIALLISSHSGEKEHIDVLKRLMNKIGISEEELECGIAEPVNKNVLKELFTAGLPLSKLHCNCSGKHVGYMAASKAMGYPIDGYYKPEHPIQQSVKRIIEQFSNAKPECISRGVDGCSVPVYAIPLKNMAIAYGNLCNTNFMGGKYAKYQKLITDSMIKYPEMVAGNGRIDTELMKQFKNIIGKSGAEGVYCAGILDKGVGIAVKIEDGSSRAVGPVIIDLLQQMDVIGKLDAGSLIEFHNPRVFNNKGEIAGEIRSVFKLKH